MMKFALLARLLVYAIVLAVAIRGVWLIKAKQEEETLARQSLKENSACVSRQRVTQQAIRALQSSLSLKVGDPVPWEKIYGEKGLLAGQPSCGNPGTASYTRAATIPPPGTLAMPCGNPEHRPKDTTGW